MPDHPITGDDARLYIEHVEGHGLSEDVAWLLDVGRFPVGCRVLDVGCGTGALMNALAGDQQYARSVVGVELSKELASHAERLAGDVGGSVHQSDFLTWKPPSDWKPDTVIMSFFLHHCEDVDAHLARAASFLPHGGRLYVFDRVAVDQTALDAFPTFWRENYRAAHEWEEEMPRLMTVASLDEAASRSGFAFVRRQDCPHDHRAGTGGFPKTLTEYWRSEPGKTFPAVMLVSPAHGSVLNEIVDRLTNAGLHVSQRMLIDYSDDLIRAIYERCPWRELLTRFVQEQCPVRKATVLPLVGDTSTPILLDRLGQFKKDQRDEWRSIRGPEGDGGFRAMILPFHVAEPYEAEALSRMVGLSARA